MRGGGAQAAAPPAAAAVAAWAWAWARVGPVAMPWGMKLHGCGCGTPCAGLPTAATAATHP